MRILYLARSSCHIVNTIFDYDSAFWKYSRHNIYYLDFSKYPYPVDMSAFDALFISYSFLATLENVHKSYLENINKFNGLKLAILQDEYSYFLRNRHNLEAMAINAMLTVMPEEAWPKIFTGYFEHLPKLQALTGYVSETMARLFDSRKKMTDRQWHIGYRGRLYRPIFGKLAHEKYTIGVEMQKYCMERQIPASIEVDINKRLYDQQWLSFIQDCRVMLGNESGCNVFDFTGEIAKCIEDYQQKYPEAGFWEIHRHCIGDRDGIIKTNQMAPRIFEAIALGTAHVLYEGNYSGIIQPWRHYIPLKKDYSNIEEVFDALADIPFLENMAITSYKEIVKSGKYSYQSFIHRVDKFIDNIYCPLSSTVKKMPLEIEASVPLHPTRRNIPDLQKHADIMAKHIAAKYKGKKVLFYGGGSAYNRFGSWFEASEILGIVMDKEFLPQKQNGNIPFLGFEEASALLDEIEGIIIMARNEYKGVMYSKVTSLLPCVKNIDACVLFDKA